MRYRENGDPETYKRDYGTLTLLAGNTESRMRTTRADMKLVRIDPGKCTSHHRHLLTESIFHVLEGQVAFLGQGISITYFSAGTTFIIEPGELHQLRNESNAPAVVLEVESPPHDSSDKFILGTPPQAVPRRSLGKFWDSDDSLRVKACGVRSIDAAWMCVEAGVDAIGIHCVGGKDVIDRLRGWSSWLAALPEDLSVFLLTNIEDPVILRRLIEWSWCDTVQFQGPMAPDTVSQLSGPLRDAGLRVVKSVGVDDLSLEETLRYVARLQSSIDAFVLDTTFKGGSGKTHDWSLADRIAKQTTAPVILAGGLRPENVQRAVETVKPFGVDVESAVEVVLSTPENRRVTCKSCREITRFMNALRHGI